MEDTGANGPGPASTLARFVQSLMNEGRARVSPQPLLEDEGDVLAWLAELEAGSRCELAGETPAFQEPAALWAARLFYQLCQFVVCRDLGEELILAACEVPCPQPRDAATDWSADLTFRHLPRLHELARHLSNADPLVHQLNLLGRAWPLSSVGMPGLDELKLDSFISHPALRRLYADRILAAGDCTRLGDRRVDELLRADLGVHQELAPEIAARLFKASYHP